jgi:hypothetical protein
MRLEIGKIAVDTNRDTKPERRSSQVVELFGGPDRDRTDDLFHAMEARSQLRHRPTHTGEQLFYFRRCDSIRQTLGKRTSPGA